MARTQIRATQVLDNSIQNIDLDTTTPGKAVITSVLPGMGISISNTGVDIGTGQVTINAGFHYVQLVANTSWTIVHNLNKFPTIITINDIGEEIIGDIIYTDLNSLNVQFSSSVKGQAYLT